MKKWIRVFLLFFVMMLAGVVWLSLFKETRAAEEITASKKIVSVVYDDSGSMDNDTASWASANYAMQAFAALLNEQDEMYITYMSKTGQKDETKEVDLSDVDASVEDIRKDVDSFGETPLESVQSAMDKLKSVKDTDETTQYWLVILTDGEMEVLDSSKCEYGDLQSMLDDYKGTTMSNGSQVYINYMGIGNAVDIKGDDTQGLSSVNVGDDIVSGLSDISNKVSGRMKIDSAQIKKVDDKTYEVTTELPLYAFSVFSQSSTAVIESAEGESILNVSRNVKLKYPESKKAKKTNKELFGNAAVINNSGKVIPEGTYTIKFSEKVSLENVVFMYEPAIEMQAVITKKGVKVDDTSKLGMDDVVDIEIVPVNPETGDRIEDDKLPEGITWGAQYLVNDKEQAKSDTQTLTDVSLKNGKNKIVCTMKVPDYIPVNQTITFTIEKKVEYGIEVEQPDNVRYSRQNLGADGCENPVKFYVLADGKRLGKEDLSKKFLQISESEVDASGVMGILNKIGFKKVSSKLKLNDDGSFTLYPGGIPFPAFLIKAGVYTAEVSLKDDSSVTAEGTYEIYASVSDWIDLWWVLLLLFLIGYLIYILFFKAKFEGQTLSIKVYRRGPDGTGIHRRTMDKKIILHKFTPSTFLPTRACSRNLIGIKFIANGYGGVCIKRRSLENTMRYGLSAQDPETNFDRVVGNLTESKNDNNLQREIQLGGGSFYVKTRTYLYQIKINR